MSSRWVTTSAYFSSIILAVLCYLGSVRSNAVWTYLFPAAVIAIVATLAPRKSASYAGLASGLFCGMCWASIVNSLSGENLGPVARSTATCILGATLVVHGLRRKEPNTSVIGELIIIFGALFYGAANEVLRLSLVAMVFHLVGYVGSSHGAEKRKPQERHLRDYLFLLILIIVSIATILATPWRLPGVLNDRRPVMSAVLSNTEVKPPWLSNNTSTSTTTASSASPATIALPTQIESHAKQDQKSPIYSLLIVLFALLLVLLAALFRYVYIQVRFRRTTTMWAHQSVRTSVSASWKWTTLVLHSLGFRFSPATPLERISNDESVKKWPADLREQLMQLAKICGNVAYAPGQAETDFRTKAWESANSLKQEAMRNAKRWRRVIFRFTRVLP